MPPDLYFTGGTMSEKKVRHIAPTAHRGGRIQTIGPKLHRITWHQGRGGKNIRLTVRGTRETADKVLQKLREEFYAGTHGIRIDHDTTVADLAQLVIDDYANNGFKDQRGAAFMKRFWVELTGKRRADTIDSNQLSIWVKDWCADGLSAGRANRRMAFLMRGYRLAKSQKLVRDIPEWKALQEAPPRSGVRTWEEFVAVRGHLPPHARIPVTIEYWLGTRSGETLAIQWSQVRFDHRQELVEIRLDAGDTKTSEQRTVVLGGDLYAFLRDWYRFTKKAFPSCQTVCHYKGRSIKRLQSSWQNAAVKAGLGHWGNPDGKYPGNRQYRGALIHDFRRTAVSNMENAGIPRKVAMSISGHKTDNVYRRYHIVKKEDLIEAGRRLMAHHQREHGTTDNPVEPGEQVFTTCSPTSRITTDKPGSGQTMARPQKRHKPATRAEKCASGAGIAK